MRSEIDSRREKLAEEMRTREMKCFENRREKEQEKKKKLKITKMKIEEKDRKVEKLLNEREQSILRARKMAETSAKLREIIKSFQSETNPKFLLLSNQTILRGKNELTRQDFNSLKNSEFIIGSNEQITEQDFILFLVVPHEIL